jgi:DNA-binding NarL/FixJ family response regulator
MSRGQEAKELVQAPISAAGQAVKDSGATFDLASLLERRLFAVLSPNEWNLVAHTLRLSHREQEIMRALLEGQKERDIAHALGMSPHTVRTHLKRMHRKLKVTDRTELVSIVFLVYARLFGPHGDAMT